MPGITRRRLLQAGVAGSLCVAIWSALRPASNADRDTRPLRVGFIYVGARDDYGYNQAHALAAARLARQPGITLVEQERVPETEQVAEVMRRMIEEHGVNVMFPTSYGYYDPYVLQLAREFSGVQFLHAGGLFQPGHPENISTYFGYIDEGMYLAGITAAHMSPGGKLGFVAAMDIPHVHRNVNAFLLGAQTVNPYATLRLRFTGGWYEPEAERAHTEELIAAGMETIACHVDSPRVVVETCAARDRYCIGYHSDLSSLAPKHVLTGVQWDWWPLLASYLEKLRDTEPLPKMVRHGLREGMIVLSPFAPVVQDYVRNQTREKLRRFMHQEANVYTGPVYDQSGELVVPDGVQRDRDDPWLETMDWFVRGVEV